MTVAGAMTPVMLRFIPLCPTLRLGSVPVSGVGAVYSATGTTAEIQAEADSAVGDVVVRMHAGGFTVAFTYPEDHACWPRQSEPRRLT